MEGMDGRAGSMAASGAFWGISERGKCFPLFPDSGTWTDYVGSGTDIDKYKGCRLYVELAHYLQLCKVWHMTLAATFTKGGRIWQQLHCLHAHVGFRRKRATIGC
jgi:hypothetical protein